MHDRLLLGREDELADLTTPALEVPAFEVGNLEAQLVPAHRQGPAADEGPAPEGQRSVSRNDVAVQTGFHFALNDRDSAVLTVETRSGIPDASTFFWYSTISARMSSPSPSSFWMARSCSRR